MTNPRTPQGYLPPPPHSPQPLHAVTYPTSVAPPSPATDTKPHTNRPPLLTPPPTPCRRNRRTEMRKPLNFTVRLPARVPSRDNTGARTHARASEIREG